MEDVTVTKRRSSVANKMRRSLATTGITSLNEELPDEPNPLQSTSNEFICKCGNPMCHLEWIEADGDDENPDIEQEDACNIYENTTFCHFIKRVVEVCEQEVTFPMKSHLDVLALPAQDYLNKTIVPILIHAMHFIEKQRPPEPIAALAAFLLKNKSQYEKMYNEPEYAKMDAKQEDTTEES